MRTLYCVGKSVFTQYEVRTTHRVKRQSRPSAYRFLSRAEQKEYREGFANDAHRHAVAARAMAYDLNDFLGWMKLPGGYYLFRARTLPVCDEA